MKLSKLIEKLQQVQHVLGQNDLDVTAGEDVSNAGDIETISVVFSESEAQPSIVLGTQSL
jgi:selenophosphate synthetase-related protein